MSRKILVAYDGTREGRSGLFEFANLLAPADAEIHLLAVVRVPSGVFLAEGFVPENVMQDEKARYAEIMNEGIGLLGERGYRATAHLAYGEPTEEIVRLARALSAQLIVIGHRRSTSFAERWWRSSVGKSLLELAPCSILVAMAD
jgi:nucleotide-binding universal stress UspA family protein